VRTQDRFASLAASPQTIPAELSPQYERLRALGTKPEKTWTGKLTLRPTEEQRRRYAVAAAIAHKSLNAWMVDILDRESLQAEGATIAAE
jgi:predicted HicB family RNase H-like nuclease